MNRLLAVLVTHHRYMDFALAELQSLFDMAGCSYSINKNTSDHHDFPHVVLQSPELKQQKQAISKIFSRAILVKKIIQLIGEAETYEQLASTWHLDSVKHILSDTNNKIKVDFHTHNAHVTKEEQVFRIKRILDLANYRGGIDLVQPRHTLSLVESYSRDKSLKRVYFGLDISNNRDGRLNVNKYALSKRFYHGPTSTDTELSFIMSHQAKIRQHQWVCDPFVGTGSLLIPAAHYNATTFGSDIDWRVLHGTAVGRVNLKCGFNHEGSKITGNFLQFGLTPPNLFRMDCLKSSFSRSSLFDAIVCDPPYGLRAMSRTSADEHKSSVEWQHQNYRKMQLAGRQHIYEGLLAFAKRYLQPGGRLVCLYPIYSWETSNVLPRDPHLSLTSVSRNDITAGNQRVLLTYHKY